MLIRWTKDNILTAPLIDVNYKGPLVGKDTVLVLLPGWNEVTDEQWDLAYIHVKDKLEAGLLELYCTKKQGSEPGTVEFVGQALRDVRADKAREIVKGCFNMKNLKTWQDDMKITTEIRHLIDRQIENIENYGEAKAKELRF